MTPYGVSDRDDPCARDLSDCLTLKTLRAPEGESFSAAAGRSLLVCTVLAAGIAGVIVTMGARFDAVQPAQAATLAVVDMPKPRVNLSPAVVSKSTIEEELLASINDFAAWQTNRASASLSQPSEVQRDPGNPNDILQFGPMRIRRHLVETIVKAAQVTDADPVLLMAIADKESSFATAVQARTSSATGLFQFIEKTWLNVVNNFGARHGLKKEADAIVWVDDELVVRDPAERERILDLRREPYLSALLAAEMLKRDAARISRRIGRDLSHGEVYLAHFLGPDDAERFMEKVVEEPNSVAAKLLPKPAKANKPIFFANAGRKAKGRSVAEVHQKFQSMMDLRLERYRDVLDHVPGVAYAEADTR
jgi:hypothetical protein